MNTDYQPFSQDDHKRWNEKVNKTETCWLWTGKTNPKGYGAFRLGSKVLLAHRVAYVQANGQIDTKLLICHKCDVRNCVNPEHLVCGTAKFNTEDMLAKGRLLGIHAGENNGRSKLTGEQVAELRRRIDAGENRVELAKEFGISERMLYNIKNETSWTATPKKQVKTRLDIPQDINLVPTEKDIARFWQYVNKTETCWLWTGCTETGGYGAFHCQRKVRSSHRFAYLINGGKLTEGLDISHSCGNRLCVRPDHLTAETRSQNMANTITRDRLAKASRGNMNHTKLTWELVREIRKRPATETHTAIARELNVTPECVSNIRRGKTWKEVTSVLQGEELQVEVQKLQESDEKGSPLKAVSRQ